MSTENLEKKVQITDPPTPAPAAEPAKPTPAAKPAAKPAPAKPKRPGPGKPGRPPGAPNKPKGGPPPLTTVPRKAAADYIDTKAALERLAKDAKTVAEKHNREHPGDQWTVQILRPGQVSAKLSPELCAAVFGQGAELLGGVMAVDSRPTLEATAEVGKKWSEASAFLPDFDPKWMAFGMAITATFAAVAPMLAESKARKMGLIEPGQHIGPNDIANGAKAGSAVPVGSGVAP